MGDRTHCADIRSSISAVAFWWGVVGGRKLPGAGRAVSLGKDLQGGGSATAGLKLGRSWVGNADRSEWGVCADLIDDVGPLLAARCWQLSGYLPGSRVLPATVAEERSIKKANRSATCSSVS